MAARAALAVALAAVVTVPSLFTRDLWHPDEPRYMEVAREMVVSGNYVIPHLNGEVYSAKPPTFFWLTGALWKLGVGYCSGRVVSALAVAGTMVVLALGFARYLGNGTALLAAAVAPATALLLTVAKVGNLDPLLMLEVTCAIALGHSALHGRGSRAGLRWLGAYTVTGAALLTKGPVGLLIPALVLGVYAVARRRDIRLGGWWHLAGAAVCAGISLAWVVPAVILGGEDYARVILLKQTVGRAVRSFSQRRPFYYYLWVAPIALFPWSALLPSAAIAAFRRRSNEHGGVALLGALWILVPLAFFSCMSGKKETYLLPIVPGVGLLVAWYVALGPAPSVWMARLERWLVRAALGLLGLICIACGVLLFVGPSVAQRIYPEGAHGAAVAGVLTAPRVAVGVVLFGAALVLVISALWKAEADRRRMVGLAAAGVIALSLALDLSLVPAGNVLRSDRHFGEAIARLAGKQDRLYLYLDAFDGACNLYSGRLRIPVIRTGAGLAAVLRDPSAFVACDAENLVRRSGLERWEDYVVFTDVVGSAKLVLLQGHRPGPTLKRPSDARRRRSVPARR